METIKVLFDRANVVDAYNFEIGNVYYLGFENNVKWQESIMFPDLTWLQKRFGENLERVNDGRIQHIKDYTTCIEHSIRLYELPHLKNMVDGKFWRPSDKNGDFDTKTMQPRMVEYRPDRLDDEGKKMFQADIDRGLLVLCELI